MHRYLHKRKAHVEEYAPEDPKKRLVRQECLDAAGFPRWRSLQRVHPGAQKRHGGRSSTRAGRRPKPSGSRLFAFLSRRPHAPSWSRKRSTGSDKHRGKFRKRSSRARPSS